MKGKSIILLVLGIWLGMVLGISFLEAPLKFKAPNMTLILGLGVGKLVFSALNKVEIVYALFLSGWIGWQYRQVSIVILFIFASLLLLIALQSCWLLPILNTRVDQLLQGTEVAHSNHHFYYVAIEIIKVGLLIYGFTKIYQHD